MTTQIFRVLCMLLFCGLSATANAQILRYDFSGTVDAASAMDPTATSQNIFGAITSPGDAYTGFFEIDLGSPQDVVIPGTVSGSAIGYEINPPLRMQLLLNGVTFENDGTFLAGVTNDFSDDASFPAVDALSIFDGVDPLFPGEDFVGSTFLAGGVQQSGIFAITFSDESANAFSSSDLPSNLNLSDFGFFGAGGIISGLDDDMNQIGINFFIDSISVTAVPEPSSFCFVAVSAVVVLRRRRRV